MVIDRLPTERCAAFKGSGSYGKRRACSAHPYNAFQEGNCYAFEPKHHLPRGCHHKTDPYALGALRRDFDRIFAATAAPGGRLLLTINHTLATEQYTLTAGTDTLLLSASDDLGFVYGLFEISRRFLGVQPFWF